MNYPSLEVRHLRLVHAIADEGGPTRAAARLHLTQSAVSHQLAELEGRLGIALFARVRRKLILAERWAAVTRSDAKSHAPRFVEITRELAAPRDVRTKRRLA